jgi:hypothetical protein
MPLRELKYPHQVEQWLVEMGTILSVPGEMILIGSGALLWHAAYRGISEPLPENSMDVDPITRSEEIARLCYDALIGSEFERLHGWHVNLMPEIALREFPPGWESRALTKDYRLLRLRVPAAEGLLVPKLKRGEPRDLAHAAWAAKVGLIREVPGFEIKEQAASSETSVWGRYFNYDELAKFEYTRLLWRNSKMQQLLLEHWLDDRHPARERFLQHRPLLEEVLSSVEGPEAMDKQLRARGTTLRCVSREIPSVFGAFYHEQP